MTVYFKDRINFFLFLLFSLTLLSTACRKVENTVGDNFVGDIVGFDVQSNDTTTIVAYTCQDDSVVTNQLSYYYLGDMNDPVFGITSSSITVQYGLPESTPSFDMSKVNTIDSIVLQIKYVSAKGFYGNTNTLQTVNVYELNDIVSNGITYYSNTALSHSNVPIGTWKGRFNNMSDSVKINYAGASVTLSPHMRIKLDNPDFINKFKTGEANFASNDKFRSYFKGLVISPETPSLASGDGAIAFVDLKSTFFLNAVTSVVMYYDSVQKFEFPIYNAEDNSNPINANVNVKSAVYYHDKTTIPRQPLVGGIHKDVNYVQSLAGLKTRVLIPNLFSFAKDKKIAITGAQLIVTAADGGDDITYYVPTTLRLDESDSLGRNTGSIDYLIGLAQTPGYYGGIYNSTNKQYVFNIRNYIQYLFKQYKDYNLNYNYGFNIYVPASYTTASRVVLDTRPGKIKLKLSYTVIK